MYAALFVVFITFMIGAAIDRFGYIGGTADLCIMRFVDSVQAFPSLVFTISIAAMLGGGMGTVWCHVTVGWTTCQTGTFKSAFVEGTDFCECGQSIRYVQLSDISQNHYS